MPCPACGSQWREIGPAGGVCPRCGPIPRAAIDGMPRDGQRPNTLVAAQEVGPVLVTMTTVQREDVRWLWPGRIPVGKLTLLEGDPGTGKSWLALAIATAVTLGHGLPDMPPTSPADVLLLTAEDGLADTVRPRLEGMGADLRRVVALTAVRDAGGQERHPSLVDDLHHVEEALASGRFRLVIIDPLNAYLGAALDSHRDAAVRSVLTPLAALAARHRAAVLAIRHLAKTQRERPIYRGQGSIAYAAAARVVLLVGRNPDEDERVVTCVKNNLSPHPPALAFELVAGRFLWRGESPLTAEHLLAPPASSAERTALEEAKGFLRAALADGPRPAREVLAAAREAGIAERTVKRAKAALCVQATRCQGGFGGGSGFWVWALSSQGGQHTQEGQGCHGGHLAPLCNPESENGKGARGFGPLVQPENAADTGEDHPQGDRDDLLVPRRCRTCGRALSVVSISDRCGPCQALPPK